MPRKNQNKTQPTTSSVADFLARIEDEQQKQDAEKLCQIMQRITGKPPVLWGPSIVGFDLYHYTYATGREGDTPAVAFSPRKSTLTIYLLDGLGNYTEPLQALGPHKLGKGCLYIKRLSDVSMPVLEKVIEMSYRSIMSPEGVMYHSREK